MKYWVFQNNQVSGPYEPEDLTQLAGYSGETLVCTEGRKGTNMGDWQRASMVPELSASLVKASQLALTLKGAGGYGALPPEPTLKDLAALGSLQEKVSLLDNTVNNLQENLRLKDDELLSLHRELETKNQHAQELAVKLGSLEERLSAVSTLRDGLDKAVAAEHDVEATLKRQSETIKELTRQLDSVRAEQRQIDQLRTDLAKIKDDQTRAKHPAPMLAPPQPFVAPQPMPQPRPSLEPQPFAQPVPVAAAPAPAPVLRPPTDAPMPFDPLAGSDLAQSAPKPKPDLSPTATLASKAPTQPARTPAAEPVAKKKRATKIIVGLALALAGGAAAYMMGLLPGSARRSAAPAQEPEPTTAEQAPTETPAAPEAAPQPDPEETLRQRKALAVEIARGWLLADGATVGAKLETAAPAAPGVEPWTAERLAENVFQVRYHAAKKRKTPAQTYDFEVLMEQKELVARNPSASALLSGRSQLVAKPRRKRARAAKAQTAAAQLPALPGLSGAAPRRPRIRAKAQPPASDTDLDALLADDGPSAAPKKQESTELMTQPDAPKPPAGQEPEAQPEPEPEPVPSKPAARAKKTRQPADAELLDDLLKP